MKVKENDFKTYTEKLISIIDTNENTIKNNVPYLNFTRSIGIVIETHESNSPNEYDYITVLFRTELNDFVINKYVVNYAKTYL